MATYLKLFETHTQYETFIGGGGNTPFVKPNVSYCTEENEVHYNPFSWADEYLTFVALEHGTISFDISNSIGTDKITSISYSTDNGANWTTTENRNDKQENLSITVKVNKGDKILWKGDAKTLGFYVNDKVGFAGSFFSSTAKFDAAGNVMSLIYGDEYKNKITIEKEYTFCFLFCGYNSVKTCGIVNAKNLSLPATTLAYQCYYSMFEGCTSLVTAPSVLPATTLASGCYSGMFYGCTSLTTAPELPATILASECYGDMFYGCTGLTTAPELPATTLTNYCYQSMFNGCTGLTTAPELPATTLADDCYNYMFEACTSLETAPTLPATTLASGCYSQMFYDCTGLTTAPELPATTLADYCYYSMFVGCTNLVNAPTLPATTLASGCYRYMFKGCSSLNYIKAMFTTTPSTEYTSDWVDGVAASGTFIKNSAATWTTTGVNGIPSGWTVVTE